jgi:uncharacterized protein (TIGR03437 family)
MCGLQASYSTAYAGDYYLVNYQELTDNGGRVSWSKSGSNLIAFDRIGTATQGNNGWYDIWTMTPDGNNQVCLTCAASTNGTLPPYNKGNADWRPQGDYLVFEAQRSSQDPTDPSSTTNVQARPGAGGNNVVYIMNAAGTAYWEVTATESGRGILEPFFSHDGTKIVWSELVDPSQGFNGAWEIVIASFTPPTTSGGAPTVTVTETLTPGIQPAYYETHGFTLDDSTILFSGCASGQTSIYGTDIYTYVLGSGVFTNLTNTPDYWDEHSIASPVQDKLFFVSSYGTNSTGAHLALDGWTMNYDGSDKKRITFFQDPDSPMSMPGYLVSENDWSPDGTQEVIYLNDIGTNSTDQSLGSQGPIYLLTFGNATATANSGNFTTFPQAPDGIAASFGTNLATSTVIASGALQTTLGGTSVSVTNKASGASAAAELVYVSPSQVNWVVPSTLPSGQATVTISSNGSTVGTDEVEIESISPSIFTVSGSGTGAPAAYVLTANSGGGQTSQNVYSCSGGTCSPTTVNILGGQSYLIVYATGIRHYQSQPAVIPGQNVSVVAYIGPNLSPGFTQMNVDTSTAVAITPAYAGAQNTDAGLDQLNLLLPASLAGTGTMYLQLVVDGVYPSNTVQLQF